MATTTIRVDLGTHARLVQLSQARHASLGETVRDAAEALHRQQFGRAVQAELAELRADPEAWNDYLADAAATSVTDGVG